MNKPWKRVVIKLSGEAFASAQADEIIDNAVVDRIAAEIAAARRDLGTEIAVVVGAGNIWRGAVGTAGGMDPAQADYMGMLATVINAMALQDALEHADVPTRVMTAIHMAQLAEPYTRRRALRHMEKGRVVIFAGGTGSPFFTTDTAAALRAVEIQADALLKGTHGTVDGIYDADPSKNPDAKKITETTFDDILAKQLRVMDMTAIAFCQDNKMPICVFNVMTDNNIEKAIRQEPIGTIVR
jgi:uridylate kinase